MLSHHELAKLLLISRAPGQIGEGDPDVAALIERALVALPATVPGEHFLRITGYGVALLRALEGSAARTPFKQRRRLQDFLL
ncbi:MAG: hypothetical protein ABIR35_08940 [Polaromonas sp.]